MTDHLPVPLARPPARRPDLPVETDRHPAPRSFDPRDLGKIEFLIIGYTDADGTVQAIGSNNVPWAEIESDTDFGDDLGWMWSQSWKPPPTVHTLKARLTTWGWATGVDMRDALGKLTDLWRSM